MRRSILSCLLLAVCGMSAAHAAERCEGSTLASHPPAVNFRVDNDLFGGEHQDQGYTNGAGLSFVSPNLVDFTDDPCLPRLARWVNRHIERLQPGGYDQQNMVFAIGQALYTPRDPDRSDLILDDRPYAGVLVASFGYNARNDAHLRTTQLQLGVVGPAALGEQVQNAVHKLIESTQFQGWDNQLHNEPVFALVHERMRRWPGDDDFDSEGWGADAVTHWGGSVGTLATHGTAGLEVRLGWRLPDDFGTSPVRPAGENTAPTRGGVRHAGWTMHVFASAEGKLVLRDITLDGNTFRDSHSVDKRMLVGDLGYGFAVTRGRWKFALARYHRSREFDGQAERPVFGSFTISRSL